MTETFAFKILPAITTFYFIVLALKVNLLLRHEVGNLHDLASSITVNAIVYTLFAIIFYWGL